MIAVPVLTLATHPVDPTVATEVLLLLQVPPEVASERQLVRPRQMPGLPAIAAGSGFTLIVFMATQPTGDVASIVTAPPVTEAPVTTPVVEPTVAIAVALLLQVTPAVASVRVMVLPVHTEEGPEIGDVALTVTEYSTVQLPVPYTILEVPVVTPNTQPFVPTVATAVFVLLQVPPAVASLRQSVAPRQIFGLPLIGAGIGKTVTTLLLEV